MFDATPLTPGTLRLMLWAISWVSLRLLPAVMGNRPVVSCLPGVMMRMLEPRMANSFWT